MKVHASDRLPSRLLGALALLALLTAGSLAAGEGGTHSLDLEDVLQSHRWLPGLPDWQWLPAPSRLCRRASVDGGEVLLAIDPRDPATVATVVDWRALAKAVPTPGAGVRGIGRAGAPRWVADPLGAGLVAVVRGRLVWVPSSGEPARVLTPPTLPPLAGVEVASGGSYVVFTADHDVWAVATAAGEPRRLTRGGGEALRNGSLDWVTPEELGLERGTWIAPDARRVAYLQLDQQGVACFEGEGREGRGTCVRYPSAGTRNPRVRVGVVPVEGGETTWLDLGRPAPEYVARATWTPDARSVVLVTLDRAQRTLRVLACPADGAAPTLLLEERDAAWVDVPPAPVFVGDREFLWRSHRDGATRWYRVTPKAGDEPELEPLTAPGIDVPAPPAIDPDGGRAVYVGVEHGAVRARAFVGVEGEEAGLAPPGEFDVGADFDPTGRWAVVTWSNATTPPRRALRRVKDGETLRALGEVASERLERLALARPETGTLTVEGHPVRWRLWRSPEASDGPRPLLLRVYGGPGSRSVVDRWERTILLTTWLVQQGFHVLEVDGRGASGWGAAHERLVAGRLGLGEIDDQAAAVRHVARRPDVDGTRVGVFGWSFGGTMTCLALTRHPDVFRAGVAIAPVTDWRLYDTIYTERYMGLPSENPEGYDATAVASRAGDLCGRLLLLHGSNDENVHVENTTHLLTALEAAGCRTTEVLIYRGCGHGLGGERQDAYQRLLEHFRRHLGAAARSPLGLEAARPN